MIPSQVHRKDTMKAYKIIEEKIFFLKELLKNGFRKKEMNEKKV